MPGRNYTLQNYRYGFNGQESEGEVYGSSNAFSFTFRTYDSRLGRFLSIDPLGPKFPYWSPYQFAGNSPIEARDLEGLESWHTIDGSTGDQTGNPSTTGGDKPWYVDENGKGASAGPLSEATASDLGYTHYGVAGKPAESKTTKYTQGDLDRAFGSRYATEFTHICFIVYRGVAATMNNDNSILGVSADNGKTGADRVVFSDVMAAQGRYANSIKFNWNYNGGKSSFDISLREQIVAVTPDEGIYLFGARIAGSMHTMSIIYDNRGRVDKFHLWDQGTGWTGSGKNVILKNLTFTELEEKLLEVNDWSRIHYSELTGKNQNSFNRMWTQLNLWNKLIYRPSTELIPIKK